MTNYDEYMAGIDRAAYREGEVHWVEGEYDVHRSYVWSAGPGCHDCCGLLYYVKDGVLARVEGDPLSPVVNSRLCIRCLNMDEAVNDPNRLKYPMVRDKADRGKDAWKRVTWDEAYDLIVEKAWHFKKEYGEQSIAVCTGTGRNIGVAAAYLSHGAFESPYMTMMFNIGHSCYLPRRHASRGMLGDVWEPDTSQAHELRFADPDWRAPGVIITWGVSAEISNADNFFGPDLVEEVEMGAKIISVDPKLTWWGARAEYWLPVRGGTDTALAMAMVNVIVSEDLYDHEFVDMWTYGFEQFAAACAEMTPEKAAEICGVDADDIRGAARLFATEGPGQIKWGVALEQTNGNCMACNQTIMGLISICGYWDIPGGNHIYRDSYGITHHLSEHILPREFASLNREQVSIPDAVFAETRQRIFDWEDHHPDRVRMAVFMSNNSIGNASTGTTRLYDIWKEQLDFAVGIDVVMNPTLMGLCDVVLPCAMSIERDAIRAWWVPLRAMKKITDYYESKTDEQIAIDIVNRMWPGRFPKVNTARDFMNMRLHDMATGEDYIRDRVQAAHGGAEMGVGEGGFSEHQMDQVRADRWDPDKDFLYIVDELCGVCYDPFNHTYEKYKKGMLRDDGTPGFKTTTGRIELYSLAYQSWGMPPVPEYTEPLVSPVSMPERAEKYPLIMNSGNRTFEYFHGEGKNQPTLREFHQWPQLYIHPKTAERFGVHDGEWTWVENHLGRFRQVAHFTEGVREDTICVENGWWYPEEEAAVPSLFKTFESNPNVCVDIYDVGIYGVGATQKCALVTVYPYKPGDESSSEIVTAKGGFPFQQERRAEIHAKWAAEGTENN